MFTGGILLDTDGNRMSAEEINHFYFSRIRGMEGSSLIILTDTIFRFYTRNDNFQRNEDEPPRRYQNKTMIVGSSDGLSSTATVDFRNRRDLGYKIVIPVSRTPNHSRSSGASNHELDDFGLDRTLHSGCVRIEMDERGFHAKWGGIHKPDQLQI